MLPRLRLTSHNSTGKDVESQDNIQQILSNPFVYSRVLNQQRFFWRPRCCLAQNCPLPLALTHPSRFLWFLPGDLPFAMLLSYFSRHSVCPPDLPSVCL